MTLLGRRGLTAALVALLGLLMPTLEAHGGLVCRTHGHSGTGTAYLFRSYAETEARQRWMQQVVAHDGTAWAAWNAAHNRSANCQRNVWFRWTCTATARVAGGRFPGLGASPRGGVGRMAADFDETGGGEPLAKNGYRQGGIVN